MKKVLLLLLFIVPFIYAQQNSKGTISLMFNGEKIDLPVRTVILRKEDHIILSIRAEHNDSNIQQMVSLEVGLNELSSGPNAETLEGTRIDINTRNAATNSGKSLSIWFNNNKPANGKSQSEAAHYGVFNKGERVSWEINSISMKLAVTSVKYVNGSLHIEGEFQGIFKSTLAPKGQVAEIKDGKFEVII